MAEARAWSAMTRKARALSGEAEYLVLKSSWPASITGQNKSVSKGELLPWTARLKRSKPMPVSEKEVARIIGAIEEGVERPKPAIRFEIGETVRVTDGPFQSFNGVVEQVDEERARLRVTVSIFGRATPVELEYGQVEKVA